MKCEKCGSEIAPGQKFCGNCGKEQVQNQKSSIDPFETQGQNQMYSQPQNQGQQGEEPDQTQGWFQGQSPNQLQMGDLKNYFNSVLTGSWSGRVRGLGGKYRNPSRKTGWQGADRSG